MLGTIADTMREGLHRLDYRLRLQLPLLQSSVLQAVELVAFGGTVPSQKSACIAGHFCPDRIREDEYLQAIAPVGVPYVYLGYADGGGQIWRLNAEPGESRVRATATETVATAQISQYLINNRDRFAPSSVLQEKFRSFALPTSGISTGQLSFAAAGLLDFQEEQTEASIVELLHRSVGEALEQWRRIGGCPDTEEASVRIGRAFLRLIAARALTDKDIIRPGTRDMDAVVDAAHSMLPSFLNAEAMAAVPGQIIGALWSQLLEASFALLTGDMLAGLYEQGLVSDSNRRKYGIHYTPPGVRRFVWNTIVPYLNEIPVRERIILDPTCGSGAFLITAYQGLARLESVDLFARHDVAGFRGRLWGVDQDPFACDLAHLALVLQSQPPVNDWKIQVQKFQEWAPAPGMEPRLVIGNPPFGKDQLASEVLQRALRWVAPGGVVSLVMPLSFLTNVRSRAKRDLVAEEAQLETVLQLPEKVFRGSQVSACVIVARKPLQASLRGRFTYAPLNHALSNEEQKKRLQLGDPSFLKRGAQLGNKEFVSDTLELTSVWQSVRATEAVKTVVDLHEGIKLKERVADPAPHVSDAPLPGYVPYLANARDHLEPFRIVKVSYLEWEPSKMSRPRSPQLWRAGKVLLPEHVTHKQRWRLLPVLDTLGCAFGNRLIACFSKREDWTSEAMLCLFASNYANAWYASHSVGLDVLPAILQELPLPIVREEETEHLSAIGAALTACAEREASEASSLWERHQLALITSILLRELDRVVCDAVGLTDSQRQEIDQYLAEGGQPRPGVPLEDDIEQLALAQQEIDTPTQRLFATTGIVLAIDVQRDVAVLWLDDLQPAVPICVPVPWLAGEVQRSGAVFEARATLSFTDPRRAVVQEIKSFPEASEPREKIIARLAALAAQ
jgi:N-6 DNA Methylase